MTMRSLPSVALDFPASVNIIGAAGGAGFGVGVCPAPPAGFVPLPDHTAPDSPNYGNYRCAADGSIVVWIPAFLYRVNDPRNAAYSQWGVNSVDVLPVSAYPDIAAANADGFALHRAFYNAGQQQPGFFIDKYLCSRNGAIASSIRLGAPLSTAAAHNPLSSLSASIPNNYGSIFAAAKTRGDRWMPAMRWMHTALALLTLAHLQASSSATWCAWWTADGTGQPRGCNNSANLNDTVDATVRWRADGYNGMAALTGSGSPVAKTSHNGQACGVVDLNGNMWEVSPGVTCIATTKAITGVTLGNPLRLGIPSHGRATGEYMLTTGVVGTTQINNRMWRITVVDANTVSLDGCDGSAFTAWTSGGSAAFGKWYALRTDIDAAALAGGNTLASDAFGAAGVAAHSTEVVPAWRTDYPNNLTDRYLSPAAQVVPSATSGPGWVAAACGFVADANSLAAGGAPFGGDVVYQYIVNELVPLAGGAWYYGSGAGVWAVYWNSARTSSTATVGFRAASYL